MTRICRFVAKNERTMHKILMNGLNDDGRSNELSISYLTNDRIGCSYHNKGSNRRLNDYPESELASIKLCQVKQVKLRYTYHITEPSTRITIIFMFI